MSEFERILDKAVGDGLNILEDFIEWEASGLTYTFKELRDNLCGAAKFCFHPNQWI